MSANTSAWHSLIRSLNAANAASLPNGYIELPSFLQVLYSIDSHHISKNSLGELVE